MCSHVETYSQCRIPFCYTCGFIYASATYLCRATLWHVIPHSTYEFRCLVQFIFVGAVYHNALSNCAALLCRTQRRVAHMCSSTVSDTANRLRKTRKKKSSVVPLFRSGHMSVICARLTNKGKVGVQRGRETAGVPSFLPRRGARHAPAVRRRRILPLRFSGKLPAPLGRTRLRQFAHPAGSVQEKEPLRQGEHADAVRAPRSAGAGKGAAPSGRTRLRQFAHPAGSVQKRCRPSGRTRLRQFAHPAQPVQRKRVPHTDICPPVKTKYFYALHYKSDVL